MEPKSAAAIDTQPANRPNRSPRLLAILALLLAIAGTLDTEVLALAEGPGAMVVAAPHDGEWRGPELRGIWAARWFPAASLLAGQIGLSEWSLRLPYALILFALGAGLISLTRRGSEAFFALSCLAPLIAAIGGHWIEPRIVLLAPPLALAWTWTRPWTRNSLADWGLLVAVGGILWINGLGMPAAAGLSLVSLLGALALRGRAARARAHLSALVTTLAIGVASRLPSPPAFFPMEPMDFVQGSPLLFAAGILTLVIASHAAWRSRRGQDASAAHSASPPGTSTEPATHGSQRGTGGERVGDILFPLALTLAAAGSLAASPLAFALPLAALPLFVARAAAPELWAPPRARDLILGGSAVLLLCLLGALRSDGKSADDALMKLRAAKALGPAQALVLHGQDRFRLLYYIHRGNGFGAPTRLIPEDWTIDEVASRFSEGAERKEVANLPRILVLLPAPEAPPRGLRALTPIPQPGGPQAFGLE